MTPIIAIAGIAGLVWAIVLFRYGDLIAGCLAVLLVGSVFGHAFFHISLITADRLLIGGLIVTYIIYRRLDLADPKPIEKGDLAVFLFIGVLGFSTLTSNWRLSGAQPLATLLFFFCLPVVMYWIGRQAKLTERSLFTTFGFFAVFAVYLALTAFAETRQMWMVVFPRYIASPAYVEFFGRGRGPFLNPVGCGLYMSAGLFGVVQWWPKCRVVGRGIVVVTACVILLGVYCTLTRSVWLGAALGLIMIVGLAIPKSWRVPMLVAVLVAGVAVGVAKRDKLNKFKRDKDVSVKDMSESASLRPILAMVAWKMFLDYPLFGCGFGQYKEYDIEYLQLVVGDLDLDKARPYHQHNVFLAMLAQMGMLGFGAWMIMLGLWTRNAWRLWTSRQAPRWARQLAVFLLALLAAYSFNGMFHDVSVISMSNMLLFFVAGVCQGLMPLLHGAIEARPPSAAYDRRMRSAVGIST
ncbi:MAG: O-antigen ligase family protein [Planctomycetaceae bacterium]|nr:O-antigen ligase family protein [Planctomycetales bacterium]MCB9874545.1 O-antigen ligase family protein [Planctomycetaceae bacterium]MCB9941583.1 O-antigen ligase family protein [Planctomycetaceae bacterium]HRX78122.1 O-antigen ligase family protein [Pirellulaceae bacterium]